MHTTQKSNTPTFDHSGSKAFLKVAKSQLANLKSHLKKVIFNIFSSSKKLRVQKQHTLYIYLVNIHSIRKMFFQILCVSQKVRNLRTLTCWIGNISFQKFVVWSGEILSYVDFRPLWYAFWCCGGILISLWKMTF